MSLHTKYISPVFQLISQLTSTSSIIINAIANKKVSFAARLHKDRLSEFSLDGLDYISSKQKIHFPTKFKAIWNNSPIILQGVFLNPSGSAGSVHKILSPGYIASKRQYHRLIIPLRKKIRFHCKIECTSFQTEDIRSTECIQANYDSFYIEIYLQKNEDQKQFLVLDCPFKINHEEFSEVAFSTLTTIGFLIGTFPQDEGYYFSYNHSTMNDITGFLFCGLRPSSSSIYIPIHSNPYGFTDGTKAKKLLTTLTPLSTVQFSTLCRRVHSKPELRAALLLLIEACSSSLLIMSTAMAVVLESLADSYASENPEKFLLVKNVKLTKSVLKTLREALNGYAYELQEHLALFTNKINLLNQVPNRARLMLPFQLLGINLNDLDKEAIEKRNCLLHGGLDVGIKNNIPASDSELHFIATKLYTLNIMLVLKQAGYNGHVVNWAVHNKHVHGKKINEEVFRLI